jgi:SAM-dependent methyltransferase
MQLQNNQEQIFSLAFDYVQGPVTSRSKSVFSRLIAPITGGNVLDLGCGANAFFWALGYAERAQSIVFADRNDLFLASLRSKLLSMSKQRSPDFVPVMNYLVETSLVGKQSNQETISDEILKKSRFEKFDFLSAEVPDSQFDFILALGSLGCTDSQEQLVELLTRIEQMLAPGGRLHAIWTPYRQRDDLAQAFIDTGIDGTLNPGLPAFESALERTCLEILTLEQAAVAPADGFYSNYLEPIFLICRKPSPAGN